MPSSLIDLLGAEAAREIRRRGERRQFRRREVLFREGDIGDSVYMIERGHVLVRADRSPGEHLTLAVLGPGDYFGDVAVLSTVGRRSAGVEALDECVMFVLQAADYLELRDTYPEVRRAMTESLARICRRLVERLVDGRHVDARGRLLRQLLHLAELFDGPIIFTQEDLAAYVGVTRVTVNQILQSLVEDDAVEVRRGSVRVMDAARIRAKL